MRAIWIWGSALVLYGVFYAWYDGLRGPLTAEEINAYMRRIGESKLETSPERRAILRGFLEADDGGSPPVFPMLRVPR